MHISGLQITLKDDKSGQTIYQKYSDLDADSASEHFWIAPSSPWNEGYTATIDAHGLHSSQQLAINSINGKARIATTITANDNKESVLNCKDITDQTTAVGQTCANALKLPPDAMSKIGVNNYQTADGNVTVLHVKQLPSPSELDEQSDDRHLTEYQKQVMEPVVAKYPGTRIAIFFAGGPRSKAYAEEFRELLHEKRWISAPVKLVPPGNERTIDAQMSVSDDYLQVSGEADKVKELLDAFEGAGIKHRHNVARDPNIRDGDMVLWVGPKSSRKT